MRLARRLTAALALALVACGEPAVVADGAWIRLPPPGAHMAAGYLVLTNELDEPVTLTGASSDIFASVMIHETRVVDGMSRMRHAAPLGIEPGERVEFAPGGLHLMLMRPSRELVRGELIALSLQFDGRAALHTSAEVRTEAP